MAIHKSIFLKCLILLIIILIVLFSATWAPRNSRYESTKIKLRLIEEEIKEYYFLNKHIPSTLNEINPITNSIILDGWGNPIIYRINGKHVELICYGADGKNGGINNDRDIISIFDVE